MRLFGRNKLVDFIKRYPDSGASLGAWAQAVENGSFAHFPHLRQTFGSADFVKPHTVFNISGNKYRLICLVSYESKAVHVIHVLTHAEYDRGKWRAK